MEIQPRTFQYPIKSRIKDNARMPFEYYTIVLGCYIIHRH